MTAYKYNRLLATVFLLMFVQYSFLSKYLATAAGKLIVQMLKVFMHVQFACCWKTFVTNVTCIGLVMMLLYSVLHHNLLGGK